MLDLTRRCLRAVAVLVASLLVVFFVIVLVIALGYSGSASGPDKVFAVCWIIGHLGGCVSFGMAALSLLFPLKDGASEYRRRIRPHWMEAKKDD